MTTIRPAVVAGAFYPGEPEALRAVLSRLLENAERTIDTVPKALIVPHAGYIYSGPSAAAAYQLLERHSEGIRRVVLLGPAHRVYVNGLAFPSVDLFQTPLGDVPLDRPAIERVLLLPGTVISDDAHALEHCLEVQLPFLQTVSGDTTKSGHCFAHTQAVTEPTGDKHADREDHPKIRSHTGSTSRFKMMMLGQEGWHIGRHRYIGERPKHNDRRQQPQSGTAIYLAAIVISCFVVNVCSRNVLIL